MIKVKFSVVHYIVQSISNKVDIIESELSNFDIICLTKTWLDERTSNDTISPNEYNLYRRDRGGDNHGGICVYAKQNVHSHRRQDVELPNFRLRFLHITKRFFYAFL